MSLRGLDMVWLSFVQIYCWLICNVILYQTLGFVQCIFWYRTSYYRHKLVMRLPFLYKGSSYTCRMISLLLYNKLFIYQVLCTFIYRRRSLYSFVFVLKRTRVQCDSTTLCWWWIGIYHKATVFLLIVSTATFLFYCTCELYFTLSHNMWHHKKMCWLLGHLGPFSLTWVGFF